LWRIQSVNEFLGFFYAKIQFSLLLTPQLELRTGLAKKNLRVALVLVLVKKCKCAFGILCHMLPIFLELSLIRLKLELFFFSTQVLRLHLHLVVVEMRWFEKYLNLLK